MKQPGTVVDYASVNSLIMKCRPPNTHTHTHGFMCLNTWVTRSWHCLERLWNLPEIRGLLGEVGR